MHFAKNSAAVHGFCIIADLYEQQMFIGVIAVSQGMLGITKRKSSMQKLSVEQIPALH